jgi:hypothetical protein
MKKELIIAIVIALLVTIGLVSIPKNELPTDQQWDSHMEYIESPEFQERFN